MSKGKQLIIQVLPNTDYFDLSGLNRDDPDDLQQIYKIEGKADHSAVYTSMIKRYYDPILIKDIGFMSWISLTATKFALQNSRMVENYSFVQQEIHQTFDFMFIDTSEIPLFDLATINKTYKIDEM